jgi:hypothetical protein
MAVAPQQISSAERARALYDELFDTDFTERNKGKLLLLDLDTREHWLADSDGELARMTEDLPVAPNRFLLRVGFPTAYTLNIAL